MKSAYRNLIGLLVVCVAALVATRAEARCTIDSTGLTISPLTASTGTHISPTTPAAQSVTFTVSGTYDTNNSAGTCQVGISFNRASVPATMARSGGGATLTYTITTAAGGGNSLLYTGGGTPALTNVLVASFASAGPNLNNRAFSITMTAFFQQQPTSPQRAGSYSDTLTLNLYNVRTNGTRDFLISRSFSVTGSVALSCTIGGVTTPATSNATIPIGSGGIVNTAPIARSFANVVCNSLSILQTISVNGGVRRTGAAPGGFTNIINYSALAAFGGATSTLNTATVPTAAGQETGSIGTTSTSTPSGTLSVTITPQTPPQPLVSGSYADTLRITITPQ